jgi:hypothetical protein
MTHTYLPRFRERLATLARTTVALAILAGLAACGGGKRSGDTYGRAVQVQEQCCENLAGPARDDCLRKIVRVDDPEVQRTSTNQQQYACVVEHFSCDSRTGHATQASAQAQLECLQDLQ